VIVDLRPSDRGRQLGAANKALMRFEKSVFIRVHPWLNFFRASAQTN
jgi:hypothetical protein